MWAWMSGSSSPSQAGVYGTRGVPAASNVPGARVDSVAWTDSSGILWLFGGNGYDSSGYTGRLNDLWSYDPDTNQWTWVSGSNIREQSGSFGTKGVFAASNVPRARDDSSCWIDSLNRLWLFGGYTGSYYLQDLWCYDPSIDMWAWMSGSSSTSQRGVYGLEGVPAEANVPGARSQGLPWIDSAGYLWMWGGYGYDSSGYRGYLNDLWRYEFGECKVDSDCAEGYSCVEALCADLPPAIIDGPFLAAGNWPMLPTAPATPLYLNQDRDVLWTFSDDYASCPEFCTHTAEYKAVGESTWTSLDVSTDPTEQWYAYATLPVESLQNATTYALRFTVTDCAGQSTQSGEYYFRVALYDDPPVIESGPFLAAGTWPVLPGKASNALTLKQNYDVLWTFSDDYATCGGDCTHRARIRAVGEDVWTWLPVETDPTGRWYAYTTLPVESLSPGTYQFQFDVRDCAGQYTFPPHFYYIMVE
jgi:hypothetical protein